ncbi:hypothetical protein Leryth_005825 [Lithospermum erythrorhizon]|nr:hypothetical protein Leryth_005825 [Lithospermum erythrorhizon]
MESNNVLGLIRIRVRRGINLVIRDAASSDPYVVLTMGSQKVKTRVVKNSHNPEWNDELTMYVNDPNLPIHLTIYDKDTFTVDDTMGHAEFDIKTLVECLTKGSASLPDGTKVGSVDPSRDNCLADKSCVIWQGGKMVQDMRLKLKNVESGEVEIQIEWIHLNKGH